MTSKTIYMRSNIQDSIAHTYSIRFLGNIESTKYSLFASRQKFKINFEATRYKS